MLDSISKPEDIVKRLKELGQKAIAITDHGNVFTSVYMSKLCQKEGVQFIYGTEIYVTDDKTQKDKTSSTYHLVLLAATEQGRLNLNKLISVAHIDYFYKKPRIDFKLLDEYGDGLIVLSACMAGEVSKYIQNGNIQFAKEIARKYHTRFGDNYYLEIQSHNEPEQQNINLQIVNIAKELGIQCVATTDAHYLRPEDQHLHSVFIQVAQDREVGETYTDCYMQSEDDVRCILSASNLSVDDINAAIQNTVVIANKCRALIPLSPPQIPPVDVPQPHKSELEYLKYLCNIGWKQRMFHLLPVAEKQQYIDRLYYEVDAITKLGFVGYYLLVYSYVNIVTRRGIARGSGGGSLVAYLLNIVDIDPVKYKLYFERFLDVGQIEQLEQGIIRPEEIKIPDIDLDFGTKDREQVLQFVVDKYGKDKVACLGTFNVMWERTAIKDVGKVLGVSFDVTNEITKTLGDMLLSDALSNGTLSQWSEHMQLFDYAQRLSGLPKSYGKHPCGRVIATKHLEYYGALTSNNGELVFQMEQKSAESLGLIKVDILSLRTIDVIYDTLDMIGKDYQYIKPQTLNFEIPEVLDLFHSGHTCGAFQFESTGMVSTLQQIKPSGLDELAVCTALFRPGSIKHIDTFVKRKFGLEPFEYLHPDIEETLQSTYGIIVFQEQLIQVGRIAGLRNPDALRKATGKKDTKLLAEVEPELREKLEKRGWTQAQIDELWANMLEFAKYSFNAAHSYAYSMIAYITMYLKARHPVEFITALINSYVDKLEEVSKCVQEAHRLNIPIKMSSWRKPNSMCVAANGEIEYGVGLLKYCNETLALEISKLKHDHKTFVDLLVDAEENTQIGGKALTIMITLNFFKEYGKNAKLLTIYGAMKSGKTTKYTKKYADKTKLQRLTALYKLESQQPDVVISAKEQIAAEKEYLGFIVSRYSQAPSNYAIIMESVKTYTPKITVYYLLTGEQKTYKIAKKYFYDRHGDELCGVGDTIIIKSTETKSRMKKTANGWEETDAIDEWITSCAIRKK